jgi:hypothetical protein
MLSFTIFCSLNTKFLQFINHFLKSIRYFSLKIFKIDKNTKFSWLKAEFVINFECIILPYLCLTTSTNKPCHIKDEYELFLLHVCYLATNEQNVFLKFFYVSSLYKTNFHNLIMKVFLLYHPLSSKYLY